MPFGTPSDKVTFKASVTLDPDDDFDKLIIPLIELNKRKRHDYAGEDIFQNFKRNAAMLNLEGYDALEDCLSMICRKIGRIINLRGKKAKNESLIDSFDDLIVYAILAKGLALEKLDLEGSQESDV